MACIIKFLLLFLITEPFLFIFTSKLNPIHFHTFIPPAIIILIGLFYLQRKDKGYVEFWIPTIFFLWCFLHCSYRFIGDVLVNQTLSYWPLLPTISIGIFLLLYYVLIDTDVRFIDTFIAICAITMAGLALLQFVCGKSGVPHRNIPGTFGNPTNLGAYLAVCLPYCFRKRYLWGVPLLIAIGLTASASATLGAIAAIIVYLFLKNKKIGIGIFIIFLSAGLIFLNRNPHFLNPHGKTAIWIKTIEVWKENPILGLGPGAFEASMFNDGATWWCRTHNLIIHILFEFGIIGFLIFLGFCIKDILLRNKETDLQKRAFASIGAFAVIAMGFIPYAIWPCCVILAYGLAILKKEKDV